jgi:hypothetical protein
VQQSLICSKFRPVTFGEIDLDAAPAGAAVPVYPSSKFRLVGLVDEATVQAGYG